MKTISLITLILLFSLNIFSQNIAEKQVKTNIDNATIYLTGAEIVRKTSVNIGKGQTQLIFKNLSSKINTKSIRVSLKNNVDLLSITSRVDYLVKKNELPRIKQLKDSVEIISEKQQRLNDDYNTYSVEKELLTKNMSIGGTQNGVSITELKQAADYYRERIKEINYKISKINFEKSTYSKKIVRINKELNELNANSTYKRTEIKILVSSESAVNTNIELKYIVNNAGWSPSYDIKAIDTDKPVKLVYRAKVYNNSDIDWKNLKIKLSTADPSLNVSKPNLQPWYLNYNSYNSYNNRAFLGANNFSNDISYTQQQIVTESLNVPMGGVSTTNGSYENAIIPELSAEFNIKKRYTIPSDDKPYLVKINNYDLPATYSHSAVTKLDKDVFLLAGITGWEDLNLIEGPANVYYGGTYLGQSYIRTRNVSDTLKLSLGRDNKVLITRTKLKKFSSSQFIGTKRKETMTYELVIKNNRKNTIDISLSDQVPISQLDDIEVKVLEISSGKLNETTGEVKWKYKLAPGQTKKVRISFSIKYPKNKKIQVRKSKSRQMRKF